MANPSRFLTYANLSWIVVCVVCAGLILKQATWKKDIIQWDVTFYYAYLPACFIYKDMSMAYARENPGFFYGKFWPEPSPTGKDMIKMTMGLSFVYAPFFAIGDGLARYTRFSQNGYSVPYRAGLVVGSFLYLCFGFFMLKRLLLIYFSDLATAATLLSVYLGTNLLYYSTGSDILMPHVYLFALITVIIYGTVRWHMRPSPGWAAGIGFLSGLVTLIRPTCLVVVLIPLLFMVQSKSQRAHKVRLLAAYKTHLLIFLAAFIVPIIPQLAYWHEMTGQWIYYSYRQERFYFTQPHLLDGLISYRKGWLLYSPVMAFALIGFFFLRKYAADIFMALLIPFVTIFYVIFCWWTWWYGGGFGPRPLIDYYGLLALPMAAFYSTVLRTKLVLRIPVLLLGTFFLAFSLLKSYQYTKGILHYDSMTRKAYWMMFWRTTAPGAYWSSLKSPDYDRAKRGLPEE